MNPYLDAVDELKLLADKLRKRSNYKRYSKGMRRAYANRAYGLEQAIRIIRQYQEPIGIWEK